MYSGSFFGYDSLADTGLNRKNFLFFSEDNGTYCQFSFPDFSVETVTTAHNKQDNDLFDRCSLRMKNVWMKTTDKI